MNVGQVLSKSGIDLMKAMAADEKKSWILVHDDVCMGGLVMVLSNEDISIVDGALQALLKLSQWPSLRISIRNFLGMKDQLLELMSMAPPSIKDVATTIYNLLYCPQLVDKDTDLVVSCNDTLSDTFSTTKADLTRNVGSKQRRRTSFFVGNANKAKIVTLQIRGLMDKDDIEVCRSQLLTVAGVISITFDFRKKRAIVRVKHDLKTDLLAKAIAQTMTMSADQVIKNEDGSETLLPLYESVNQPPISEMPDYPSEVDSPVTGHQNIVRHGISEDSQSWGFMKTIGNFISNSFYW